MGSVSSVNQVKISETDRAHAAQPALGLQEVSERRASVGLPSVGL